MDQNAIVTVAIGLVGSGAGTSICMALISHYSNRDKTKAEAKNLAAEAEEVQVRAEEGRLRITQQLAKASLPAIVDTGTEAPLPAGWQKWGKDASAYEMGSDAGETRHGKRSGYVKWRRQNDGFGTMMQVFRAENFKGQRLRLSAHAKTSEVVDWAGIWMRVDGHKSELLAFDNMQQRPIRGTTDWAKYQVVLDVPEESARIAFGFLLEGPGQVWCGDLALETVSRSVATTDLTPDELPTSPINLDFSQ